MANCTMYVLAVLCRLSLEYEIGEGGGSSGVFNPHGKNTKVQGSPVITKRLSVIHLSSSSQQAGLAWHLGIPPKAARSPLPDLLNSSTFRRFSAH